MSDLEGRSAPDAYGVVAGDIEDELRSAVARLRHDATKREWEWADNRWTQLMDDEAAIALADLLDEIADELGIRAPGPAVRLARLINEQEG